MQLRSFKIVSNYVNIPNRHLLVGLIDRYNTELTAKDWSLAPVNDNTGRTSLTRSLVDCFYASDVNYIEQMFNDRFNTVDISLIPEFAWKEPRKYLLKWLNANQFTPVIQNIGGWSAKYDFSTDNYDMKAMDEFFIQHSSPADITDFQTYSGAKVGGKATLSCLTDPEGNEFYIPVIITKYDYDGFSLTLAFRIDPDYITNGLWYDYISAGFKLNGIYTKPERPVPEFSILGLELIYLEF